MSPISNSQQQTPEPNLPPMPLDCSPSFAVAKLLESFAIAEDVMSVTTPTFDA
jgi:hypothetical protein